MKKFKIKTGDEVQVIAGKSKGKTGKITKIIKSTDRVIVSGVNMVHRHTRPTPQNAGGIVEKDASLHVSNVAILDPKDNKPTRVAYQIQKDGKKVRVSKRTGETLDK